MQLKRQTGWMGANLSSAQDRVWYKLASNKSAILQGHAQTKHLTALDMWPDKLA